jgi:uncharacterized protein YukE
MSGSANHQSRTQRDTLHVIASLNPGYVAETVRQWQDLGNQARALQENLTRQLDALLQEQGWTGDSAETFRARITSDLSQQIAVFAQQATDVADALAPLQETADTAYETASTNGVPWDRNAPWRVEQKKVNFWDYAVNTAGDVVSNKVGIDEALSLSRFNAAQKNADYMVKDAGGALQTTVSASTWSGVQAQSKPQTEVTAGVVAPSTNQFDVWMEALNLNSGAKAAVTQAANVTESTLVQFLAPPDGAPEPITLPDTIDAIPDGGGFSPGVYGSTRPNTGVYGEAAPNSGIAPGFWVDDAAVHVWQDAAQTEATTQPTWTYPGTTWIDGTQASGVDSSLFGGSSGSSAGSAIGSVVTGAPAAGFAGVAGAGMLAGTGMSGRMGGMPGGLLGAGSGSVAAGGPPTFQVGQGGRPVLSAGAPGTVAANQPASSIAQATGRGATAAPVGAGGRGAGGAGPAGGSRGGAGSAGPRGGTAGAGGAGGPLAGRRDDRAKKDADDLDGTWLEEQDEVWGISSGDAQGQL